MLKDLKEIWASIFYPPAKKIPSTVPVATVSVSSNLVVSMYGMEGLAV